MKYFILSLFSLLLSGCLSSGSSSSTHELPIEEKKLSKDQADLILQDLPCVDCDDKKAIEFFRTTDLNDFSQWEVSTGSSAEALYAADLLEKAMDWNSPKAFVSFFHVYKLSEKIKQLCKPAEIPATMKGYYKELSLQTSLDLLVQVDRDMRDLLFYVQFREPELIDRAFEKAKLYQTGQMDRLSFETDIDLLKTSYVPVFQSYDESIAGQVYLLDIFKGFEKQLGLKKQTKIPSDNRLGWVGHVEFLRSKVVDENKMIQNSDREFLLSLREKNKWDSLRYSGSLTASFVKFVFPLPGEEKSDYEQSIENLKVNLKESDKCFLESCLERLNTIQRELKTCLN